MSKIKKEYIIAGVFAVAIIGISAFSIYANVNMAKGDNGSKDKISEKSIELTNNEGALPVANNGAIGTKDSDTVDNSKAAANTTAQSKTTKNTGTASTSSSSVKADVKYNLDDIIPVEIEYKEYAVKKGDTLSKIWRENIVCIPFSRARTMICAENELASEDDIKPGQSLRIPAAEYADYIKYRVSEGETLYTIAKKYNSKINLTINQLVDILIKINGEENVENIEKNQVILIPQI